MELENYKNIRDYVWKTLIGGKVKSLPVDLFELCRNLSRKPKVKINLYNYTYGFNMDLITPQMVKGKVAFTTKIFNEVYIFYNDNIYPNARVRYAIAHEIGHLVLKHNYKKSMMTVKEREAEANKFAILLLAPAIVLHCCNAIKTNDIMMICDISYSAAKIRAKSMATYEKLNKYDTLALEREVHKAFQEFIDDYNNN